MLIEAKESRNLEVFPVTIVSVVVVVVVVVVVAAAAATVVVVVVQDKGTHA